MDCMWAGGAWSGGWGDWSGAPGSVLVPKPRSPEELGFTQGKWAPNPSLQGQQKSLVRPELKPSGALRRRRSWSSIRRATLLSVWGGLVGVRRTRAIRKGEASAVQGSDRGHQFCVVHVQKYTFWREDFRLWVRLYGEKSLGPWVVQNLNLPNGKKILLDLASVFAT